MSFRSRALAVLLSAVLLYRISLWQVSFSAEEIEGHSEYKVLSAQTVEIYESGSWRLAEDIALKKTLTVTGKGTVAELCLCGHELSSAAEDGAVLITVTEGATLNIRDCSADEANKNAAYEHSYRYVYLIDDDTIMPATANALGGLISGGGVRRCIQIQRGAAVNLYGGTIAGGKAQSGGGVYVEYGELNVFGGIIEHNLADVGGGIALQKVAQTPRQANLYGGSVRKNVARDMGGGIHVGGKGAALKIAGGQLTENRQIAAIQNDGYGGGGVYLSSGGEVNITGGKISDNSSAVFGGGVFVGCSNRLVKTGIQVQGSVVIADNRANGEDSDVYLYYDSKGNYDITKLLISGALAQEAQIGICYGGNNLSDLPCVCIPGDGYTISASDMRAIFSNGTERAMVLNSGEILICDGRTHPICGQVCEHEENHPYVIYSEMEQGFDGGILSGGNYYLTGDVSLTSPIVIPEDATVRLCLSGYTITNLSGSCFDVERNATLSIADCTSGKCDPAQLRNPATADFVSIWGGGILGNAASVRTASGGISVNGGRLELYGGTVGCASRVSGVSVVNGGEFYLNGGAIVSCYSKTSGGGVYVDASSRFVFHGGQIENNYTSELGGGIYAESGFDVSGSAQVLDNRAGASVSNVYLPKNTLIKVSAPISGNIGISMEEVGVFTAGGAAGSVLCFSADAQSGLVVDPEESELALKYYSVQRQPTSDNVTVEVRSPENVESYQWFFVSEGENKTVESESSIELKEGDTLRVRTFEAVDALNLSVRVDIEIDGEIQTILVPHTKGTFSENGKIYVTALEAGKYFLTDGSGGYIGAEISVITREAEVEHQNSATYTGRTGNVICRIAYNDGVTVLYSQPVYAETHRHDVCGYICSHGGKHAETGFTAIANSSEGGFMIGEETAADGPLELSGGSYYLASDLTLPATVIVTGNVSICLNGHTLFCESDRAVRVTEQGNLIICSCGERTKSVITGASKDDGGGIYSLGELTLCGISVLNSSARYGGGICLEAGSAVIENCVIEGNSAEIGSGIYLNGAELTLRGDVSIYNNKYGNLYIADSGTVTPEDLLDTAKIGISAEKQGAVTKENCGAYFPMFEKDMMGWYLSVNFSGRINLKPYTIVNQPTDSEPEVEVNSAEEAVYKWFGMEGIDANSDKFELKKWQLVVVEAKTDPEAEMQAFLKSDTLMLAMTADEKGRFVFDIPEDGEYRLEISAAEYSAKIYTVNEDKIFGDTKRLSADKGVYVCRISYPDGTVLQSAPALMDAKNNSANNSESNSESKLPFTDVSKKDKFYNAVQTVYKRGLMEGTEDNKFSPYTNATRAMMMTVLWRMDGQEKNEPETPFTDVSNGAYYSDAVAWGYNSGITNGVSDKSFEPETTVTKEQAAVFLYRYAGYVGSGELNRDSELGRCSDTPEQWSTDAISWALSFGIIDYCENGLLQPKENVNRAELAEMLVNLLLNLPGKGSK